MSIDAWLLLCLRWLSAVYISRIQRSSRTEMCLTDACIMCQAGSKSPGSAKGNASRQCPTLCQKGTREECACAGPAAARMLC